MDGRSWHRLGDGGFLARMDFGLAASKAEIYLAGGASCSKTAFFHQTKNGRLSSVTKNVFMLRWLPCHTETCWNKLTLEICTCTVYIQYIFIYYLYSKLALIYHCFVQRIVFKNGRWLVFVGLEKPYAWWKRLGIRGSQTLLSMENHWAQDQFKMCSHDLIGVELQEKVCQNCVKQRVLVYNKHLNRWQ